MKLKTRVIATPLMRRNGNIIAITLFGLVFTPDPRRVDARVLNHELIHCHQQLEWLYIPFFILYIAEWLWLVLKYRNWGKAYRNISFEREAYDNESNPTYLLTRRPYANYHKRI